MYFFNDNLIRRGWVDFFSRTMNFCVPPRADLPPRDKIFDGAKWNSCSTFYPGLIRARKLVKNLKIKFFSQSWSKNGRFANLIFRVFRLWNLIWSKSDLKWHSKSAKNRRNLILLLFHYLGKNKKLPRSVFTMFLV